MTLVSRIILERDLASNRLKKIDKSAWTSFLNFLLSRERDITGEEGDFFYEGDKCGSIFCIFVNVFKALRWYLCVVEALRVNLPLAFLIKLGWPDRILAKREFVALRSLLKKLQIQDQVSNW